MPQRQIQEEQHYKVSLIEIENYVKNLKSGKAMGEDGIPNEFYKEGGEKIQYIMG